MKRFVRRVAITIGLLLVLASPPEFKAQVVEDYGYQGMFRSFKGQVQDGAQTGIQLVRIFLTHRKSGKETVIEPNEGGIFDDYSLVPGYYNVEVRASGFNVTSFSMRLNRSHEAASTRYILVGLSPGCASGGFGVKIVRNLR